MDAQPTTQRANKRELDLLRVLGQELKIPLIHIAGAASLLHEGCDGDLAESRDELERIRISAEHSLHLIDTLLLAGKLETQQIMLDVEPINLASIVHAVTTDSKSLAQQYHRTLHVTRKGSFTRLASANAQALSQAIHGIIAMAIKSSESEVIECIVQNRDNSVLLTIQDDGQYIEKKSLASALQNIGLRTQPMKEFPNSAGLSVYAADVIARAQQGNFALGYKNNKRTMTFALLRSEQMQLAL